jgi:putative DNA primase/helicase
MEIKKEDVIRYWKFLGHKKQTEIRAIRPRWFEGEKFPKSIYISNEEQLVKEIEKINGEYNIYIGINERKENGKEDADIEFITNIGHDIDAHGKGVEGLNKSGQIAFKIKDICLQQGFKEPLILNSGHGFWVIHHLPPIENNEENVKKIKEFGKKIKAKYEEEPIEIDTTVYNPSRIARVPGTINISDKDDFALSLIMNNPDEEEDYNLRDEILAIKLEEYKPNPLATSTPSICSFMDYCLTHEVPKGERHKVISRNMAIYISNHPDRELLKQQYSKIQKGSEGELDNYLKGIDEKGKDAFPFSIGELVTFTKKYKIPFDWKTTSEYKQWMQSKKAEKLLQKEIKFEEELQKEKGNKIKLEYLDLAHDKKWSEATELLVDYILSINKIYTTKEDIKSECWIYKDGVYIPQGKSQIREDLRKLLGKYYSDWIFGKVREKIEPDTFIDSNKFFNINYVDEIPIQNGILNVVTKELKPFDKNKIFFNKLPIIYNPIATCPAIEKHLKDVLKFDEDINVMYEIIGFLLYKSYFLEKMIMFIGDGRNGKGKTIDLIRRFLGVENCASVPLSALADDNFRVSELFGRMANLAGDLSNTSLKDTGMLKQTTGRDLIGANRKFLNDIKFINYAKHIFACNELPKVYDMSKGFWSRWIVLEFPYEFINEGEYNSLEENKRIMKKILDPYHIDKISSDEELSGLLNKALEGLQRIRTNKTFSYSKGTDEIKKFWIRKSDSFVAFCFDNLEEANDQEMTKAELRKAYHKYCSEHKLKGCSDKAMSITLQEMFGVIESRRTKEFITSYVWEGIKFKAYSKYNLEGGKLL